MEIELDDLSKPIKPDNFLVWAILSTVLCCLPFGIVSCVYASKVDNLYSQGKYKESQQASLDAKKWAKIAAIVGVAVVVLYILLMVVFVGVGIGMNEDFQ